MKLKTHELTEVIIEFSRLLQKNLKYYFDRSTYCFVNFNIDGRQDISLIQVFYSEKSGFFSAKYQDRTIIRYAFGKYDKLNFQLAKKESNPLNPLFVFDFPLDYSQKKYGAVFAKINRQYHILSKVYKLSEKDIETLNYSYNVYPIEGKDYALFDFGSFKYPKKFLKYLEEIVDVLEFSVSPTNKLFIKPYSIKSITKRDSVDSDYKYCMVCGHKLESTINLNLLEFSRKFPARCESCLEKIYALDLYYKLEESVTSSKMVYLSDLTNLWDEEGLLGYNMKLLSKFEFLKPFHDDVYKLYPNDDIISIFSPLLNPIEETEEEDDEDDEELRRLLGLDDEEKKCKICGKILEEEDEEDICSDCLHKQNAIPQIHKLLRYVKPGTAFTKSSIINKGLKSYDLDIICSYLVDLKLLRDDMDDLLILESKSVLNDFIRKYSDDEEDLIPEEVKEVEKIKIKNSQLNEYTIDRAINLIDFIDYVEVTFVRELYEWEVLFKKDGEDHFQVYDNPFEAKLAAINYLEKLDIIEIIDDVSPIPESPKTPKLTIEDIISMKTCPICDSGVSNISKTYCDECTVKYNTGQRKALVGIRNCTYTKKMAREMKALLDKNITKTEVARLYDISSPSYIDPIIDFLLNDYDFPFEIDCSKRCPICGKKVSKPTKTYCDECTVNYSSAERRALVGIKQGLFTKKLAREMLELKKDGKNNPQIARKVKLPDCHTAAGVSLVNPIIKFLLVDEVGEELLIELDVMKEGSKIERPVPEEPEEVVEPQPIEEELDEPEEPTVPKVKECDICGTEFAPKASNGSDKYCEECKSKYSPDERIVLVHIKEGSITKETAIKIVELQEAGKNNKQISKILKLPKPSLIPHIVRILLSDGLPEDEEDDGDKTNTCVLCEEKFVPKSSNGSDKFCPKCKSNHTTNELYVLLGVKEGKYTKELADKFVELQKEGKYNTEIGKLFGINPGLINPIIKYFENETSDTEELHKHLFESDGNIILKGIIGADDYSDLFSFISIIDCDLNKLTCNKIKNKDYELYMDFNLKDYDIPLTIRKLESLGWKKK